MRRGLVAIVLAAWAPAHADDKSLYDRLWPEAPDRRQLTLSQQIEDQLTELGYHVDTHLSALTNEIIGLKLDGRARRAYVRIGGGHERYLTLHLASDIHFTQGMARVTTKVDLRVRGRKLELELPELDVAPASYRGERGVEIRVPLVKRRF